MRGRRQGRLTWGPGETLESGVHSHGSHGAASRCRCAASSTAIGADHAAAAGQSCAPGVWAHLPEQAAS